jgi:hypothetical protein
MTAGLRAFVDLIREEQKSAVAMQTSAKSGGVAGSRAKPTGGRASPGRVGPLNNLHSSKGNP